MAGLESGPPLKRRYVAVLTPVPENMTLFGNRVTADGTGEKKLTRNKMGPYYNTTGV